MDFFDEQDQARKRSKWLVVLFCLGVISIALSVFFVASYLTEPSWNLFWLTGAGTVGVVTLASLGGSLPFHRVDPSLRNHSVAN